MDELDLDLVGADAGSFANNTAFIVLVVAAVLSVLKLAKEYHEL